jgi:hypothetical protein
MVLRTNGPEIALEGADPEANIMSLKRARCTVVEVPLDGDGEPLLDLPPTDLLPWADPYIAKLLTKHRLQAALDDSLQFVEDEAAARTGLGMVEPRSSPHALGAAWERFQGGLPPDSEHAWQS